MTQTRGATTTTHSCCLRVVGAPLVHAQRHACDTARQKKKVCYRYVYGQDALCAYFIGLFSASRWTWRERIRATLPTEKVS